MFVLNCFALKNYRSQLPFPLTGKTENGKLIGITQKTVCCKLLELTVSYDTNYLMIIPESWI